MKCKKQSKVQLLSGVYSNALAVVTPCWGFLYLFSSPYGLRNHPRPEHGPFTVAGICFPVWSREEFLNLS